MNLWELQLFKLDDHANMNLQTFVDEINREIEEWIKLQAVFIFNYNKIIESNYEYLNVNEKTKYAPWDQKTIWRKNLYINYSKTFKKKNLKSPERQFTSQIDLLKVKD